MEMLTQWCHIRQKGGQASLSIDIFELGPDKGEWAGRWIHGGKKCFVQRKCGCKGQEVEKIFICMKKGVEEARAD